MKDINDFWEKDISKFTLEELTHEATNAYTEDFINNYARWKDNISELNQSCKEYLVDQCDMPESIYVELDFDGFCKKLIYYIKDFISKNKTIEPKNMLEIVDIVTADIVAENLNEFDSHLNSVNGIIMGLKKVKFKM